MSGEPEHEGRRLKLDYTSKVTSTQKQTAKNGDTVKEFQKLNLYLFIDSIGPLLKIREKTLLLKFLI